MLKNKNSYWFKIEFLFLFKMSTLCYRDANISKRSFIPTNILIFVIYIFCVHEVKGQLFFFYKTNHLTKKKDSTWLLSYTRVNQKFCNNLVTYLSALFFKLQQKQLSIQRPLCCTIQRHFSTSSLISWWYQFFSFQVKNSFTETSTSS